MDNSNYEKLVSIISKYSGLGKDEIERKIVAKREKISGLISREGAAQVVAAELGISFDNEKLKIDELLSGMKRVNITGKIINISPVRTFTRNGQEGKVVNLLVADETSNIKVVLWDTNHISLIESKEIGNDSVVEIYNATMRENELHLGNFSEFKPSKEILGNVKTEKVVKEKNISDLRVSDNVNLRAFIVQAFEPRAFNVCSTCKKKLTVEGENYICAEHGKIVPEKRFLINLVLDDGTGTIRAVVFHDNFARLGFSNMENNESVLEQKEILLGKEMFFSGMVKMNSYFNNPEFSVNLVNEINIEDLINSFEKNT
jgi:ssDNA-binding replication factor A large subunit